MAETYPEEFRTVERTTAVFAGAVTKGGSVVLDLAAGSLIEAKRFVPTPGRCGKALGPTELAGEMREETREMRKDYGA
jgi:hypothetical protein